jgi:hypothetical protein
VLRRDSRLRIVLLTAILLVVVLRAGGYVWNVPAAGRGRPPAPRRRGAGRPRRARAPAHLVFRSTALGDDYGRVAVVPLTATGRATGVHPGRPASGCTPPPRTPSASSADRGIVTTYRARLLDAAGRRRVSCR